MNQAIRQNQKHIITKVISIEKREINYSYVKIDFLAT